MVLYAADLFLLFLSVFNMSVNIILVIGIGSAKVDLPFGSDIFPPGDIMIRIEVLQFKCIFIPKRIYTVGTNA